MEEPWPPEFLVRLIKAMCPEQVCRTCGEPRRKIVKSTDWQQEQFATHFKERRLASGLSVDEVNGWFGYVTAVSHWEHPGEFGRIPSARDWPILKERLGLSDEFDAVVARTSAVSYEMLHDNGPKNRGRTGETAMGNLTTRANRIVGDVGFSDCGHDDWRPGLVLDPFGRVTAEVATALGRDAIGVDID